MNSRLLIIIGIVCMVILSTLVVTIILFGDVFFDFMSSQTNPEKDAMVFTEINQQAIIYQKNNEQEKFDQQMILMKEKLKTVASNALGISIISVYLDENYNFPFVDASKVHSFDESLVCDITPKIPVHFQYIRKAKMFQMFMQKYSQHEIELIIQDERRYNSTVHYQFVATSEDKNNNAFTHFHANSCDDKTDYSDFYFLHCGDILKDYAMNTSNQNDIVASFEHDEFCIIPLDPWRQSVYDYGKTVSEKMNRHHEKIGTLDKNYESVMAFQSEMDRLGTLGNLIGALSGGDVDSQVTQERIQEYNEKFGSLPDELLELIEKKE